MQRLLVSVRGSNEAIASIDPLKDGPSLATSIDCEGVLIDTFRKDIGKGLLDYYSIDQLASLVHALHDAGKEAWLAGSLTEEDLRIWS